jgi:hypothetical protein
MDQLFIVEQDHKHNFNKKQDIYSNKHIIIANTHTRIKVIPQEK